MASAIVEQIVSEVKKLSPEEYLELLIQLKRNSPVIKNRNILELDGLGRELWEKVDVDKYIEDERNSWD